MEPLILHEDHLSGNCYKIRLTAALLGFKLHLLNYSVVKNETRTADFLSRVNANGRVPVLQIGSSTFLPESNAACYYLASGSPLIPSDRLEHAEMLQWLFWEQYQHEPNIASLRYWYFFLGKELLSDMQRAQIPQKVKGGEEALDLMENHLANHPYFVAEKLTLADIALYAYTHAAGDAEFDLKRWPNILAWCKRITSEHKYISLE